MGAWILNFIARLINAAADAVIYAVREVVPVIIMARFSPV